MFMSEETVEIDYEAIQEAVVTALKGIYDPEIPVNIYDLGLIYRIDISTESDINIEMTLTTPGCPVAQTFPGQIKNTVELLDVVKSAQVDVVWDPPWTVDKMSEEAKLALDM
jgi:FeS assembly SUF system protein